MSQPSRGDNPQKFPHFRRSPKETQDERREKILKATESRISHSNRSDVKIPPLDVSRQSLKEAQETQDERREKILKATESRISHSNRSDVKTPSLDVSRQSLKEAQETQDERRERSLNITDSRIDHYNILDVNTTENNISSSQDITKQLSKRNEIRDKAAEAAEKRRDNESKDEATHQVILQRNLNNHLEAKEKTEQDAPPQVNRIGNIEHVKEALNNDKTIYTYWNRKDSSIFFTNDLRKVDKELGKGIDKLEIQQSLADNSNIQRIDPEDGLNKVERFGLGYKVDIAPERIEQVPQRSHAVPQEFRLEQAQTRFSTGEIPLTTDNPLPTYHTEQGPRVANNVQNMLLLRSIEEGHHIIYNTQHMSFEQRRQMQQRWLDSVPQQFRNLLHNIITEELNEQQHRQLMHDIIQDKNLNIQIPNQKAQEWAKFAANLISEYEDEIINPTTGERRGLGQSHLLGDILQGGTRVEASWNEIRNSDEYKALMTWVLTKWQEWPGRKQQEQQERSRLITDRPTPHTFTVNEQVPNRQNPATVETSRYDTETKAGPDSQSSSTVDIPKPLQETQESSPEARSETSPVHSEHSHIPDIGYDGATSYEEDSIFPKSKKKRKKELPLSPEKSKKALFDISIITSENKKRQTTQETERIRQEQAYEAQEEYFLQEYNALCEAQAKADPQARTDLQATLARFYEQRAREMQELDAQNRQMHFDTRPEILGY